MESFISNSILKSKAKEARAFWWDVYNETYFPLTQDPVSPVFDETRWDGDNEKVMSYAVKYNTLFPRGLGIWRTRLDLNKADDVDTINSSLKYMIERITWLAENVPFEETPESEEEKTDVPFIKPLPKPDTRNAPLRWLMEWEEALLKFKELGPYSSETTSTTRALLLGAGSMLFLMG